MWYCVGLERYTFVIYVGNFYKHLLSIKACIWQSLNGSLHCVFFWQNYPVCNNTDNSLLCASIAQKTVQTVVFLLRWTMTYGVESVKVLKWCFMCIAVFADWRTNTVFGLTQVMYFVFVILCTLIIAWKYGKECWYNIVITVWWLVSNVRHVLSLKSEFSVIFALLLEKW